MATTRLYLIRHGATEENERGILVGSTDVPLSDKGRGQAMALARLARSDWFPLKFDSVYKDRLDYEIENRYGHEIRIENAELEGKKVIFIEMLFYWSPEDRESYKERNGLKILGDYFRTWFDPETGAMVKCDSARMKTDRTLIPGGSTAHGYFMRVKEVPEKVLKDFEMVRSEDFEGWTTYRGAESISIDPSESIEPSGAKEGAFQTFLSPAGTYNGVRFWAEARLNNRTKSYSGVAKSVASQSINSIGGYYFGLREYCNGIMHGNTPYLHPPKRARPPLHRRGQLRRQDLSRESLHHERDHRHRP